ncbi:hypothetical protein IV203_005947 [Nitzschia inconspicua]|uniref:Uncharacterized protein n=1 Tax=Nitzschia inconspicua TaxID=303405 RepID=A0A9K3KPV0_9STRA|nr:hypothetical protein IV203_005947 [Nitzschia inconspicua]
MRDVEFSRVNRTRMKVEPVNHQLTALLPYFFDHHPSARTLSASFFKRGWYKHLLCLIETNLKLFYKTISNHGN